MDIQEFIDLLHELIVVDTDDGLVESTSLEGQIITVNLADGTSYKVSVAKN